MQSFKLKTIGGHEIDVALSDQNDGNTDSRFGSVEDANRSRVNLYKRIGLSAADIAWMRAEGGSQIVEVKQGGTQPDGAECDGLITTACDIGLALFPADCIPMVVYDQNSPVVGLAHVGRTGAELGLHTSMVDRMIEKYGATKDSLGIYMGPSIQKKSFAYSHLDFPPIIKWFDFMEEKQGMHYFDLPGMVLSGLYKAGIDPDQITVSSDDTGAPNSGFFSHRRHKLTGQPNGRNGIVVALRQSSF